MIERLRAAWAALRGGLVLSGHGWVVVYNTSNGSNVCRCDGITTDTAATMLYQAADAMCDRVHGHSTVH
ncbi:MAG TPA: hypothetical protein VGV14_01510 [Rhodanobacter sp.]|nr:hypothetical protein [Rhodanobacter sp.]